MLTFELSANTILRWIYIASREQSRRKTVPILYLIESMSRLIRPGSSPVQYRIVALPSRDSRG